jgi:hypothetical protein
LHFAQVGGSGRCQLPQKGVERQFAAQQASRQVFYVLSVHPVTVRWNRPMF